MLALNQKIDFEVPEEDTTEIIDPKDASKPSYPILEVNKNRPRQITVRDGNEIRYKVIFPDSIDVSKLTDEEIRRYTKIPALIGKDSDKRVKFVPVTVAYLDDNDQIFFSEKYYNGIKVITRAHLDGLIVDSIGKDTLLIDQVSSTKYFVENGILLKLPFLENVKDNKQDLKSEDRKDRKDRKDQKGKTIIFMENQNKDIPELKNFIGHIEGQYKTVSTYETERYLINLGPIVGRVDIYTLNDKWYLSFNRNEKGNLEGPLFRTPFIPGKESILENETVYLDPETGETRYVRYYLDGNQVSEDKYNKIEDS